MSENRKQETPTRSAALSRRTVLGSSVGAAAATLLPAANAAAAVAPNWSPKFLSADQGQMLATLCDLILPRTNTPSATEAGVHEYIDEALSVAPSDEQLEFLGGLAWVDRFAQERFSNRWNALAASRQTELLSEIADDRAHDEDTELGAAFFSDLKRRTLFGYFTSRRGRTEALGLPETVRRETLEGCKHGAGGHG